jgi:hypothetical protein
MEYDELIADAFELIGETGKIPDQLYKAEHIFKQIHDHVQQVSMFVDAADKRLEFKKDMEEDYPYLSERLEYAWYIFLERVCSAPTSFHITACVVLQISYIYEMMIELKQLNN